MHRNKGKNHGNNMPNTEKQKQKKLQLRMHLLHLMVCPALTIQTLQITHNLLYNCREHTGSKLTINRQRSN